jgi:hypothetical protein
VVAPLSFRMCFDYLSTLDRNLSITEFFGIQLMVSLSNNVLIPFISLIFINPNCFYYFFIARVSTVQSSDEEAVEYLTIKYDAAKAQFYPQLVDYSYSSSTEYQPPFVYNYQCSFSILKYYSPAFVYVSILAYVQRFEVCFEAIEAESRAAVEGHLLNRLVLSLTALSCLFYTFFLFDILGDDVGAGSDASCSGGIICSQQPLHGPLEAEGGEHIIMLGLSNSER